MLSMPEDPYILYEILFTLLLLLIMTVVDNISNPPPPPKLVLGLPQEQILAILLSTPHQKGTLHSCNGG